MNTVTYACGTRTKIMLPIVWWAPKVRYSTWRRCPGCVDVCGQRVAKPPRWIREKSVA